MHVCGVIVAVIMATAKNNERVHSSNRNHCKSNHTIMLSALLVLILSLILVACSSGFRTTAPPRFPRPNPLTRQAIQVLVTRSSRSSSSSSFPGSYSYVSGSESKMSTSKRMKMTVAATPIIQFEFTLGEGENQGQVLDEMRISPRGCVFCPATVDWRLLALLRCLDEVDPAGKDYGWD